MFINIAVTNHCFYHSQINTATICCKLGNCYMDSSNLAM